MDASEQKETAETVESRKSTQGEQELLQLETWIVQKKSALFVILALLLGAGILGGIIWCVYPPSGNNTETVEEYNVISDENSEAEITLDNKIVNLSVNDFTVRNLYYQFRGLRGWDDLLDNNLSTEVMLSIAIHNADKVPCLKNYTNYATENACFSSDELFNKVYELFGQKLDETSEYITTAFICERYEYNQDDKVFHRVVSGCSSYATGGTARALYRAEKKDQEWLRFYEVRARFVFAPFNYVDGEYRTLDDQWDEVRFYRVNCAETLYGYTDRITGLTLPADDFLRMYINWHIDAVELNALLDYIEELDRFQWNFVWNGENYVFGSVEKV